MCIGAGCYILILYSAKKKVKKKGTVNASSDGFFGSSTCAAVDCAGAKETSNTEYILRSTKYIFGQTKKTESEFNENRTKPGDLFVV